MVRYRNGNWEGETAAQLFTDTVGPVCSPQFAASHTDRNRADLLALPLLQLETFDAGVNGLPLAALMFNASTGPNSTATT